jgi:hypothetical protein
MRRANYLKNEVFLSLISICAIVLNIYFAWTSHVLDNVPNSATASVPTSINSIPNFAILQMQLFGLRPYVTHVALQACNNSPFLFTPYCPVNSLAIRFFVDYETVGLVAAVFLLSFLLFYPKTKLSIALIRAFQITSTIILPLGIEIYLFDRSEFFVQSSVIQIFTMFSWFTNADLLCSCVLIQSFATTYQLVARAIEKNRMRKTRSSFRAQLGNPSSSSPLVARFTIRKI